MTRASNSVGSTKPSMTNRDHRRVRHIKRNVRLHKQIRDLVDAHPTSSYVGGNAAIENMAVHLGFEPHDLAIADIRLNGKVITVICVPHRIWNRPYSMGRAIDLRFQARFVGHSAILVPQAFVDREPRLENSRLLAGTAKVKVDATSRMVILGHLIESGPCCLAELAALVPHTDPFGAVLHLVTTGAVSIQMDRSISPYSMIEIARPPHTLLN